MKFIFTAKSFDGKVKTGILESESVRDLAQTLKQEGFILAKAEPKTDKAKPFFSFGKVSVTEKMMMTRNLLIMISTGLSLVKGFSILSAQAKNLKMKKALADIAQEISKGKSLSDSFKKYPAIFSELYRNMIMAGEESGTLEDVLKILSLQLEKEHEMNSKIQKALIYPVILICTMMIAGVVLALFVLPKINIFFQGLNADLPLMTRIILGAGDFSGQNWPFMLAGFLVFAGAICALFKSKNGRLFLDTVSLKIPYVSSLVIKSNSASIIRSLSSLLAAGVALVRSLEITSGNISNYHFKQALADASKKIEKGEKLSVALEEYKGIFPYGAIEMMEIGEETGKTSIILKKLAEFYEEEVSAAADNLSVVIEPVLIVIIGLAVGVFAISIIGPMYSVLGTIQ